MAIILFKNLKKPWRGFNMHWTKGEFELVPSLVSTGLDQPANTHWTHHCTDPKCSISYGVSMLCPANVENIKKALLPLKPLTFYGPKRRMSHNFERFLENEGLWPTSTWRKWIWAGNEDKSPARKVRNFHCKSKLYAILRKFSESWSVCEMRSSQANLSNTAKWALLNVKTPPISAQMG